MTSQLPRLCLDYFYCYLVQKDMFLRLKLALLKYLTALIHFKASNAIECVTATSLSKFKIMELICFSVSCYFAAGSISYRISLAFSWFLLFCPRFVYIIVEFSERFLCFNRLNQNFNYVQYPAMKQPENYF